MSTRISSIFSTGGVSPRQTVSRTAGDTRTTGVKYDQLLLSKRPQGEEKRVRELVGQISCQVRMRHTTGELSSLREQVQNGTYQPDAAEVAARMLLVREEE